MEGSAVIRGTVTSAMQDLQLALSNDAKSHVFAGTPDTFVVERSHLAGWVIPVCVLAFPLGLLALLAPRRYDRGTIAISDNGDGTVRLRMAGTFYRPAHAAINRVIEQGSQRPTPATAHR